MKELLVSVSIADCEVQTFRAGGKGGQHQNKTETGVRVIHKASGAVGESRESRSQLDNKRSAFRKMAHSRRFKMWVNQLAHERASGKTIEQVVDESLDARNIKVEVRDETGVWVETV